MKNGAADWRTGQSLTLSDWHNENIDIHHIFPKKWCQKTAIPSIPSRLFDSVINKTPIDAKTNRIISGNAPSHYLAQLRNVNNKLNHVLETHWLNPELLQSDQFVECFVERGEAMLNLIEQAMNKQISGGRETLWNALVSAGLAASPEVSDLTEIELDAEDIDEEIEFDELGEAAYADVQLVADD